MTATDRPPAAAEVPFAEVPFAEALAVWTRVGFLSFGGAAGQIALLHKIVVEEKKWLDETRFLHALNYCTLLPGPEAQQLATYIGWLLHGVRGGLAAGLLFVLPGAAVVLAMSMLYVTARGMPVVEGVFLGIKAAVLVIVVQAAAKMAARIGQGAMLRAVMAVSFVAIALVRVPYPLVVLLAAACGALFVPPPAPAGPVPPARPGRLKSLLAHAAVWGLIWWLPVAVAALVLGGGHVLTEIGVFFSQLAVVTFGGAYALLVWLAQAAVEERHWLTAAEMADGLGLAETKPGPTILVTQFVGFLAAWRAPEPFAPMTAAVLGAAMTTWVTFAPSFLWIFAGAPYVEEIRHSRRIAGALRGVTAAVIGVILYLAVWFGLNVIFGKVTTFAVGPLNLPTVDPAGLDVRALGLTLAAFALAFGLRLGLLPLIAAMAGLGVAARLALG